jgi:hypothetical protein
MGIAVLATAPAQAIPFNMQVFVDVDGVPTQIGDVDEVQLGCVDTVPGEAAHCVASDLAYGPGYEALNIVSLDFLIDNDPIVNGSMTVTNSQPFSQHYSFIFTLPVPALPAGTLTSGSFQGTVRDGGVEANGATITTDAAAGAFYTALLDGNDWQDLYLHPQSFSSSGTATTSIPALNFGIPVPVAGPAVAASIGIRVDFNLTGLDRATFTSVHTVTEVPEPQTGALVALGLALLAKRRRHATRM